MSAPRSLRARLATASPLVFSLVAVSAGFVTYFSMYGVRKPFAVGTWAGPGPFGLDLKDALILGQIFGYTISKFLGTKVCAEVLPQWRAPLLFGLVLVAELALVAAGLLDGNARVAALFVNGLPLGMVWGLVFRFLEGRRTSDLIGAGLSCSYIVASGQVKAVGQWFLNRGVPEAWMPAVTGALFLVPFAFGVWLLAQLPQPAPEDVALRSERGTMNAGARSSFLRTHWLGLAPLLFLYFFLTAFRDFRDNYSKEIWAEFGRGADPSAYATPELIIAFLVLGGMASLTLVRTARRGVLAVYAMMLAGMLVLGASTFAFRRGAFDGPTWMTLVGLGLYLSYVPFGCVLFDRIVALVRSPGTAVFAIQLSDAIGYTGAVTVTVYKKFGHGELSKLAFLEGFAYVTAALCGVCFVVSLLAFLRRAAPAVLPFDGPSQPAHQESSG